MKYHFASKFKPNFKIDTMSRNGWIAYSHRETRRKLGTWDPYRPTKDELSQLPGAMRKILLGRIRTNFEEYGRKIMAILVSFMEAGRLCGFQPLYSESCQSVSWMAPAEERKVPLEFACFLALAGPRWRKNQSMNSRSSKLIQELLTSGAFLRFIVDTGGHTKIRLWSMPKMRIR